MATSKGAAGGSPDNRSVVFWRSMGIEDPLPMEAFVSLLRAQQLMWSQIDDTLKPLDLGVTRFLALATIMETEGGCRLSDLSSSILVHPTTVTMIVDQLTKQGLVKREPHATDRRSTLAVITPAGRALTREAFAALERIGFGISNLNRAKLKRLVQALADLRAEFDDVWPTSWKGN